MIEVFRRRSRNPARDPALELVVVSPDEFKAIAGSQVPSWVGCCERDAKVVYNADYLVSAFQGRLDREYCRPYYSPLQMAVQELRHGLSHALEHNLFGGELYERVMDVCNTKSLWAVEAWAMIAANSPRVRFSDVLNTEVRRVAGKQRRTAEESDFFNWTLMLESYFPSVFRLTPTPDLLINRYDNNMWVDSKAPPHRNPSYLYSAAFFEEVIVPAAGQLLSAEKPGVVYTRRDFYEAGYWYYLDWLEYVESCIHCIAGNRPIIREHYSGALLEEPSTEGDILGFLPFLTEKFGERGLHHGYFLHAQLELNTGLMQSAGY